jgi:integrating conjugative element protein (TIGR03752 family)
MKTSGLLKWLVIPAVLLVAWGAIKLFSHSESTATSRHADQSGSLTAQEMKALGVAGDTPQDTLATLIAQVKQLRGELKAAQDENKQSKAENERLHQREGAIDERIETRLAAERDHWQHEHEQTSREQQETQTLLKDLEHRLNALSAKSGKADLPVGLGLREDDAERWSSVEWIEPQDTRPTPGKTSATAHAPNAPNSPGNEMQFPTSFAPASDSDTTASHSSSDDTKTSTETLHETHGAPSSRPVYTVPANATLMGSVAMTALIGRVPIDGTVHDPYPFKVLIGTENLTANGIEAPELAGAVASGTASGDWTLSCVRGQIRSLTFVFRDGTIRTVSTGLASRDSGTEGGLGWISDPYGFPCVSGEQRSNARQYLTSQTLITAAGAGAASLIPRGPDTSAFVTSGGNVVGTVGLSGQEAMGRVLASGVRDVSEWVNKLYGQAFAAIIVAPGARVAVHIEQPLNIDYETQGRRVHHLSGASDAFTPLD